MILYQDKLFQQSSSSALLSQGLHEGAWSSPRGAGWVIVVCPAAVEISRSIYTSVQIHTCNACRYTDATWFQHVSTINDHGFWLMVLAVSTAICLRVLPTRIVVEGPGRDTSQGSSPSMLRIVECDPHSEGIVMQHDVMWCMCAYIFVYIYIAMSACMATKSAYQPWGLPQSPTSSGETKHWDAPSFAVCTHTCNNKNISSCMRHCFLVFVSVRGCADIAERGLRWSL